MCKSNCPISFVLWLNVTTTIFCHYNKVTKNSLLTILKCCKGKSVKNEATLHLYLQNLMSTDMSKDESHSGFDIRCENYMKDRETSFSSWCSFAFVFWSAVIKNTRENKNAQVQNQTTPLHCANSVLHYEQNWVQYF